jgi:SAM-dependent methyltransferase
MPNQQRTSIQVIALLRKYRYLALKVFSPIEQVLFRLSGISGFPPLHLRRAVGATATPDGSSMQYLLLMKMVAGAKSSSSILDIGCGCGMLEMVLARYVTTGRIVGIDIHMPSLEWAKSNISSNHPNIDFVHADIYNRDYWPTGKKSAAEFFSGFQSSTFDLVVAKSLFTHMLIDELPIYFEAIANNLTPGGKGLLSFFLLNEDQNRLQDEGRADFAIVRDRPGDPYGFRRRSTPSAAVGYDESFVKNLLGKSGLNCLDTIYGSWSGRLDAPLFQDILLVEKRVPV